MDGLPQLPLGDYGDLTALFLGVVAMVGYFVKRRTKSETYAVTEVVDDGVLGKFSDLFKRIGQLELDLQKMTNELNELVEQLHDKEAEMETYRARAAAALEAKDKEIRSLRTSLENHRRRIKELEDRLEEST